MLTSSMTYTSSRYVFFFQAEDGIRGRDVTGVQTCALPICPPRRPPRRARRAARLLQAGARRVQGAPGIPPDAPRRADGDRDRQGAEVPACRDARPEIGRASCRERVEIGGVGESVRKKKNGK